MQLSEEALPSAEEVAAYLRKNPQFFEHHSALLTELYLPSPHGGGTVSLAERQQLAQRDRIRVLEAKVAEFLQYGRENDQISEKVHRLSLGLLAIASEDEKRFHPEMGTQYLTRIGELVSAALLRHTEQ